MSLYTMYLKVIKLASHFMRYSSPRIFPGFYCYLPFNLGQTWGYYRQHWKRPQQLPYKHHGVRSSGLRLWGHSYASFLSPTTRALGPEPSNEKAASLSASQHLSLDFRPFFFIFIFISSIYPDIFLQSRTSQTSNQYSSSVNPDQFLFILHYLREAE